MISTTSIIALLIGIVILLFLILKLKIHAFLALLITSIVTGLIAGLDPAEIMQTVQTGMGSTLGFVATVVGLGAIFGGILEKSGGAQSISNYLIKKFGDDRAPIAMLICGFIVSIPVFFDVAFIILVPVIYSIQRQTKKSLLLYGVPLLVGLAITHAFIPPTPGPVAVADILKVDLGSVIITGFIVGIPTAIISGLIFGKFIARKIHINAPTLEVYADQHRALPNAISIIIIILVPIILILISTATKSNILPIANNTVKNIITLIGHPFSALIIANLIAWYVLGIQRGYTRNELLEVSKKSFVPVGTIILLTGAGGVFKQVLVDTKIGEQLANALSDAGMPLILFAFVAAAIVRILQGSATVAMITAAGLLAAIIIPEDHSAFALSCVAIAIASGATIFSHVNDSGFWLVSQYLGTDEKQTFKVWSVATTVLALCGFTFTCLLYYTFA